MIITNQLQCILQSSTSLHTTFPVIDNTKHKKKMKWKQVWLKKTEPNTAKIELVMHKYIHRWLTSEANTYRILNAYYILWKVEYAREPNYLFGFKSKKSLWWQLRCMTSTQNVSRKKIVCRIFVEKVFWGQNISLRKKKYHRRNKVWTLVILFS